MNSMEIKQYLFLLCIIFITGCSGIQPVDLPTSSSIYLGVNSLGSNNTRAAIDEWDNTAVSIAYAYAPSTIFDRSLTVSITDDNGEHINTGMEYPSLDTEVSFIGYHPVAAPSSLGVVDYDLSKGDVDVMISNKVSGKLSVPVSQVMTFEHKLTRFTFLMQCKAGESYPEPVNGVTVTANTAFTPKKLMTYVTLDLNSANGTETFKIPGTIFNGSPEGVPVPQDLGGTVAPLVFDVMVQPKVPLLFKVVTLTDEKTIDITSSALWDLLTETDGGTAGEQYTIKLEFSGEKIIAQGIRVSKWLGDTTVKDGGVWW